jgi:hypothetical protein
MKTILAGAAFATFLALAFSAPSQGSERPPVAEQSGAGYQGLYLPALKSNRPTPNSNQLTPSSNQMEQWPCSTAHDFCPGFHGDNG